MKTIKLILFLMMFPIIGFAQLEQTRLVLTDGINGSVKQSIEDNVSWLLQTCNEAVMTGKKPDMDGNSITKEARKAVEEMWKTSPMACPVSQIEEICIQTSTGYQVRNIPVTMMAANDSVKDQELVVSLTDQGMIDGVSIAISENKYKEIMSDFLIFKMTHPKDLKYIESVFSDNALIITGKVVKEKPKSDYALRSLSSEKIVYQKRTKKEYIANLKKVFASNKYLNVIFDEVEVIQHPKLTDIYGVTLKQEWNSDRYRDVGFVFLMIDFQDELHPLIQVRTWQPEKLDGRVLARDEVFNLGDFDIVRSLVND